ncbi:MAG: helix-turn-helix protein [Gemmatimonadetes bacterium]|nr:helix-turn-helix protein [Gemmatimonadota bacterium]
MKARRAALGLTQRALAERLGAHKQTIVKYEAGGSDISGDRLGALVEVLGPLPSAFGGDEQRERVARRLPKEAADVVQGYLDRMREATCSEEQIDEAERVMVDGAYNKLNKRDIRARTVDDLITDIDAAWDFIRYVLRKEGMRL